MDKLHLLLESVNCISSTLNLILSSLNKKLEIPIPEDKMNESNLKLVLRLMFCPIDFGSSHVNHQAI